MTEQDERAKRWREGNERPRRTRIRVAALVLLALAIVGGAGGLAWRQRAEEARLAGEDGLIKAPAGPYKIRPTEPGGMRVDGQGSTAFAASEGEEAQGRLDLGAAPEEPLTASGGANAGAAAPATNAD